MTAMKNSPPLLSRERAPPQVVDTNRPPAHRTRTTEILQDRSIAVILEPMIRLRMRECPITSRSVSTSFAKRRLGLARQDLRSGVETGRGQHGAGVLQALPDGIRSAPDLGHRHGKPLVDRVPNRTLTDCGVKARNGPVMSIASLSFGRCVPSSKRSVYF